VLVGLEGIMCELGIEGPPEDEESLQELLLQNRAFEQVFREAEKSLLQDKERLLQRNKERESLLQELKRKTLRARESIDSAKERERTIVERTAIDSGESERVKGAAIDRAKRAEQPRLMRRGRV
jgi:hypothetical protein